MQTGCLVTGEPDFSPPERTRPQLIPSQPPTTELIKLLADGSPVAFSATVLSEDAGEDLETFLLINYGFRNSRGSPYEIYEPGLSLAAGTLTTPRPVTVDWFPELIGSTHDCKSVTLVVTHERVADQRLRGCPKDPDDVATLTWHVAFCESLQDCTFDDCLGEPPGGFRYCEDAVQESVDAVP